MHDDYPLITIAITCYNYGEYVSHAIESAIWQSYPNTQIVIYDDGSTDNSLEEINKFADNPKVRIVSRKNKGIVYTRNQALDEAIESGSEYLVFLDADNVFPEEYIMKLYDVAIKEEADVVYGDMKVFGDTNNYSKAFHFDIMQLITYNYIDSASLLRLQSLDGVRFDPASEELTHEDWIFFVDLAFKGLKFAYADNGAYLFYRMKDESRNAKSVARGAEEVPEYLRWKKWYEIQEYMINKQQKAHPERFVGSAYHTVLLHKSNYDKAVAQIEQQQAQIEQQQAQIEQQQAQLNRIYNSIFWKIGRVVTFPVRRLRRSLNARRKQ